MTAPGWLGPLGHVGLVVDDFDSAMIALEGTGTTWSSVLNPEVTLLLPDGDQQEFSVRYVAAAGAEPRLKIISAVPGTYFTATAGNALHHLSYWVDDLAAATAQLEAAGFRVDATGIGPDGRTRYRYVVGADGLRIELGLEANRSEFDDWANAR